MSKQLLDLSIVIPCKNEKDTIGPCVIQAFQFLQKQKLSGEVLVVDNGSTDHSGCFATESGARVITETTPGYGAALRAGIRNSKGKYILMYDADLSYDPMDAVPMLELLQDGVSDMVIGNRFQGGMEKDAMPFSHKIGAPILSLLAAWKFHTKNIHDFHCGIRAFRGGYARMLERSHTLHCLGMDFATELIGCFTQKGYAVTEVPVTLHKDGRIHTHSHLRTIHDGFAHLKTILFWKEK